MSLRKYDLFDVTVIHRGERATRERTTTKNVPLPAVSRYFASSDVDDVVIVSASELRSDFNRKV